MPCFCPRTVWKSAVPGRNRPVFNIGQGIPGSEYLLPCGQCSGCREDYARTWSNRLVLESKYHRCSSFITCTYDTPHLPQGGVLVLRHIQLFMKRVRKHYAALFPELKISFYCAAEYGDHPEPGERFGRPHYHLILFGVNFIEDRKPFGKNKQGDQLYISETLSKLWGMGICKIGDVTAESCKYVAGYVNKKLNGPKGFEHYNLIDHETGEVLRSWPREFATMSRRPAIGVRYFRDHGASVYRRGSIIIGGKQCAIPKSFDRLLAKDDPLLMESIKTGRFEDSQKPSVVADRTPERLAVRCESLKLRRRMFNKRDL